MARYGFFGGVMAVGGAGGCIGSLLMSIRGASVAFANRSTFASVFGFATTRQLNVPVTPLTPLAALPAPLVTCTVKPFGPRAAACAW